MTRNEVAYYAINDPFAGAATRTGRAGPAPWPAPRSKR